MKLPVIFFCLLILFGMLPACAQTKQTTQDEGFSFRVIATQLKDPWELTYGPDNYLWVTEAKGYQVSRVNPADGSKTLLLDLNKDRQFSADLWPQGGLMGMALHPGLLQGKPYVYLAYVYRFNNSKPNYGGNYFSTRIVRFSYDPVMKTLGRPVTICDSVPGSSDHNGGRLLIAPENGKDYLFYSIGDMGAGQFENAGRPNHAQNKQSYEGKILRFNIEPDSDQNPGDSWIPNDNPFNGYRQNAVWSYGHRNPQGLAFAIIDGQPKLYSCEHGPFSDDEVNIIEKGKNYGHPLIIGYNDNNYNGLAAGVTDHSSLPGKWHTTYPVITSENDNAKKIGADYRDPVKSFNPSNNAFLTSLYQQISTGDRGGWPSVAPSSIQVYTSDAIPGWKNSLLITTLKGNKLIRLKLSPNGEAISGDEITYFSSPNRFRDLAISPDGTKIYMITDRSGFSSGPTRTNPQNSAQSGAILEYTYTGKK